LPLAGSTFGGKSAWTLSGGYRLGKFTPFAACSRARADKHSDPGLTVTGLQPFLAGPATALNAGPNAILNPDKPIPADQIAELLRAQPADSDTHVVGKAKEAPMTIA